jgi:PPE-repeat protein
MNTTRAVMVHPLAVAANRSQLVALVRSNLFGFAAPAIAATEAAYEEMWATDVGAMAAYHGAASAAAAQLAPWQELAGGLPGLGSSAAAAATKTPFTGGGGLGQVAEEFLGSVSGFAAAEEQELAQAEKDALLAIAGKRQDSEENFVREVQRSQTEVRKDLDQILVREQLAQQAAQQAVALQLQERLKLSWFS